MSCKPQQYLISRGCRAHKRSLGLSDTIYYHRWWKRLEVYLGKSGFAQVHTPHGFIDHLNYLTYTHI